MFQKSCHWQMVSLCIIYGDFSLSAVYIFALVGGQKCLSLWMSDRTKLVQTHWLVQEYNPISVYFCVYIKKQCNTRRIVKDRENQYHLELFCWSETKQLEILRLKCKLLTIRFIYLLSIELLCKTNISLVILLLVWISS